MTQDNRKIKGGDVNKKNWFFGDEFVAVKNCRDNNDDGNEGSELGEKVIGISTVDIAVHETPENSRSKGDFDVFPSAFVDGSKETEDFIML